MIKSPCNRGLITFIEVNGYHYYIEKDVSLFQTRNENEIGLHARHYNALSIGICYEGDLDEKGHEADTHTPAQRVAGYVIQILAFI